MFRKIKCNALSILALNDILKETNKTQKIKKISNDIKTFYYLESRLKRNKTTPVPVVRLTLFSYFEQVLDNVSLLTLNLFTKSFVNLHQICNACQPVDFLTLA